MYQGFRWLAFHAVDLVGCYPLALHFYHLWFFHGQRTPGFISINVLLPQIANPSPACPSNFAAVRSFPALLSPPPWGLCLLGWRCGAARRGRRKVDVWVCICSCSVWRAQHWGLGPECKASGGFWKGCSDENNSWPAGLGTTEGVCLSLSSSLLYVLSDFIYCVFLWNLEEYVRMDLRWKGLVLSCGDPGREFPVGAKGAGLPL